MRTFWALLLLALLSAGCAGTAGTTPLSSGAETPGGSDAAAEANGGASADFEDFHFVVMADRTGGMRAGVFREALGKVNLLRPEFVTCVGDLIEGYTDDAEELDAEWAQFDAIVAELDMPFHRLAGNHDVSNAFMRGEYKRRYGSTYRHFVHEGTLFLFLDTQDDPAREDAYRSGLGPEQVDYVKETLRENADARWTFVFMHQPFFAADEYAGVPGWEEVQAILSERPHTVFAGHWHEYSKHDELPRVYYRLATTGGANELSGLIYGKFDHIMWVAMTGDGPVVTPILTDGILPDDVTTHEITHAIYAAGSNAIGINSMVVEGDVFEKATTAAVITNDGSFPMTVRAVVRPDDRISVSPDSIECSVAPHSSEKVEMSFMAAEPSEAFDSALAEVDWELSLDFEGRPPLQLSGTKMIVVESMHTAPRRATPVEVDGSLDDWEELPFVCTRPLEVNNHSASWTDADDSHFRFGVAYDDEYLYVAVKAHDDRLLISDEYGVRQCDGVTIVVDPRPAELRAKPDESWAGYLAVLVNPGATAADARFAEDTAPPEGSLVASVTAGDGHVTEVAIPVSAINRIQGRDWTDVQINVRQHDRDDQEGYSTIWWRPNWLGRDAYEGSGTFKRE